MNHRVRGTRHGPVSIPSAARLSPLIGAGSPGRARRLRATRAYEMPAERSDSNFLHFILACYLGLRTFRSES
jgi:hypothetical protein